MNGAFEIAEKLCSILEEKGYIVYWDDIPEEDAECPHIQIQTIDSSDTIYKGGLTGNVSLMVHVWHNRIDKKKEVFQIMENIKAIAHSIKFTESYSFLMRSPDERLLYDTTTSTPYLHGVVTLNFLFS